MHPATLLNSLNSVVFGGVFRVFLYIVLCHLQTVAVLLLPFLFGCLFFFFSLSLLGLIAMARSSNTMLKKSGNSGYFCLVPDLRGKAFSFSQSSIMLLVGLSYMAYIRLRYVPFILTFWSVLIINGC